jgi:hypothetical protein
MRRFHDLLKIFLNLVASCPARQASPAAQVSITDNVPPTTLGRLNER